MVTVQDIRPLTHASLGLRFDGWPRRAGMSASGRPTNGLGPHHLQKSSRHKVTADGRERWTFHRNRSPRSWPQPRLGRQFRAAARRRSARPALGPLLGLAGRGGGPGLARAAIRRERFRPARDGNEMALPLRPPGNACAGDIGRFAAAGYRDGGHRRGSAGNRDPPRPTRRGALKTTSGEVTVKELSAARDNPEIAKLTQPHHTRTRAGAAGSRVEARIVWASQ